MLQRIASGTLESHNVLINAGLRNNVLVEEIVVAESATQRVVVPRGFAFHPRFVGRAEVHGILLPLRAGVAQRSRRTLAVFPDESVRIKSRSHVAVEKSHSPALARLE